MANSLLYNLIELRVAIISLFKCSVLLHEIGRENYNN